MHVCSGCSGVEFELDEQEQLLCVHCGSVSAEGLVQEANVGDDSVLLSGSRRKLKRARLGDDSAISLRGAKPGRSEDGINSKKRQRIAYGQLRIAGTLRSLQITLQRDAADFWSFFSPTFVDVGNTADAHARFFENIELIWRRYLEILLHSGSVCVFPDVVNSYGFIILSAKMLKLPLSHSMVTTWISKRFRENLESGFYITITRFWHGVNYSTGYHYSSILYHMLAISYKLRLPTNKNMSRQSLSSQAAHHACFTPSLAHLDSRVSANDVLLYPNMPFINKRRVSLEATCSGHQGSFHAIEVDYDRISTRIYGNTLMVCGLKRNLQCLNYDATISRSPKISAHTSQLINAINK